MYLSVLLVLYSRARDIAFKHCVQFLPTVRVKRVRKVQRSTPENDSRYRVFEPCIQGSNSLTSYSAVHHRPQRIFKSSANAMSVLVCTVRRWPLIRVKRTTCAWSQMAHNLPLAGGGGESLLAHSSTLDQSSSFTGSSGRQVCISLVEPKLIHLEKVFEKQILFNPGGSTDGLLPPMTY